MGRGRALTAVERRRTKGRREKDTGAREMSHRVKRSMNAV